MKNIISSQHCDYASEISITEEGMALSGRFVFSTISGFEELATKVISAHANDEFIVNCEKMTRIDSAGIALLLGFQRQCIKMSKTLYINGLSKQALSLLDAYRLTSIVSQ